MRYNTAIFFATLTKPEADAEYKEFSIGGVSVWVRAQGGRMDIETALGTRRRSKETLLNSIDITEEAK